MTEAMPFLQKYDITFLRPPTILSAEKGEHERAPNVSDSYPTPLRATLRAPPTKWAIKAFFRRVSAASRGRGQPLRAVCPRNVVRLFRPLGRNWTTRIYSGRPTVRLPQTEAWAERERVPSGHNCRRQLATGRPEQIQEPGTAVPGTPIFANNAQRGGPPLESPCRWLSLVLSFASKESTTPFGAAAPPSAPESARHSLIRESGIAPAGAPKGFSPFPSSLLSTFLLY